MQGMRGQGGSGHFKWRDGRLQAPPGHNYAFAYPSLKPLSPIAEQDYTSPHSSRETIGSGRKRKVSMEDAHADGDDKVSIRVKAGSLGSASGIVMSWAGSGNAADGTGIHNKPGNSPSS
jgi:hypothetical protein